MRHYAIGDIHGQLALLQSVHEAIERDLDAHPAEHKVVHIGDYVDRGPQSRQVIDFLMAGQAAQKPWIFLLGNHDRMMTYGLQSPPARDPRLRAELYWLHARLGGLNTLTSYGLKAPRKVSEKEADKLLIKAQNLIPPAHLEFLASLQTHYQSEDCFFAHAGVNPERRLADQVEEDLIWIREPFLKHQAPFEKLIIHGHTPCEALEHSGNRINVDTGAAYGYPLSVIGIEDGEVFEVTAEGRKALPKIG